MLTTQEILREYTKCLMDPVYAIETYLETFDKTQEGFVPFKLFYKQKEIVKAYKDHRFNIITKPRQAGVSTTTAAFLAIRVAFADKDNPESILILANKQDMAQEFLSKVKDFLSQLPRWIWGSDYYGSPKNEEKTIFLTESKKELRLPNNSRVKAVATSKDALRGYTPTYLVMDEAAFIDNGVDVFGAALTALGTGGRATLISTPNGQDPLYYETYEQAKQRKNNFNVIEMKWYEDPRYNKDLRWYKFIEQEDGGEKEEIMEYEIEFTKKSYEVRILDGWKPKSFWYEEMCKGMNNNARMIAQELDVSFLGSGGNVISDEHIEFHEKNNVVDPKYISGDDNEFWIFEEPIEGHQYILGADVARGDGADFSTIWIIDFTTMEQVMEYRGKVPPDLFATIIYEYGNLYQAYTVVDITGGMGVTTVLKLVEMNYTLLHYDDKSKLLSAKNDLDAISKDDKIPGFNVNGVRLPMIANLEFMIRTNQIKIKSRRTTGEMRTFIYKNGRPDHQEGKHDDLLMALAMGLWVLEHSFKKLEKLEKQTKAMLDAWLMVSPDISDDLNNNNRNGFVSQNNRKKEAQKKPNFSPEVKKNMQDPNGDYMWLFSGMI